MPKTRIECRRCRHYFITWQPATPHGCRAMSFQSKVMPSVVVYRNSGKPCLMFKEKLPTTQGGKPA